MATSGNTQIKLKTSSAFASVPHLHNKKTPYIADGYIYYFPGFHTKRICSSSMILKWGTPGRAEEKRERKKKMKLTNKAWNIIGILSALFIIYTIIDFALHGY